jgi:CRISPR-associated protein Csb2
MLTLKVEYLTGVCMATRHDDPSRSTAEWPPHPDRLYSALVAAAADPKDGDDEEAKAHIPDAAKRALQWLAEQDPPGLAVSAAQRRAAPDVHMPSNPHEDEVWQKPKRGKPRAPQKSFDLRKLLPVHRKKAALPIPAVVPDEPAAFFIWADAEPDRLLIDTLRAICERVAYLGRSRSLVRVSIVDDPPPATHVADALGQVQLRVPGPDRLCYLISKYKRDGGKPEPSPVRRYRTVDDDPRQPKSPRSIFDRMYILKPDRDDPVLPAVSTLKVTQALRRGLLRSVHERVCGCDRWNEGMPRCEDAPNCYRKIPTLISGYDPDYSPTRRPHLAFVALPFVHPWQRHADGTIKGLAVLVPHNPADEPLQDLAAALMRLQNNRLEIPGIGTWHLKEVPADDPPLRMLDARYWTGSALVWSSVTPTVFGHVPKEKKGGEVKIILDSLGMIGFESEAVVEIAIGRHSPLHGVPPSWCFKTRRDREPNGAPPRLVRHVMLRFKQAVRGPIVLGCMRYFGLGLMRPRAE